MIGLPVDGRRIAVAWLVLLKSWGGKDMTAIVHHLASLTRLLFTRLPLTIETRLSLSRMRLKVGSLPFAYGLALTWLGPDQFRVESQTRPAPFQGGPISPVIELRLTEKDGLGTLEGFVALPALVRSVLIVVLLALVLFAVGVVTGVLASEHPTQVLPVVGLALSILELVHLAVLSNVRRTVARLSAVLASEELR